jgi:Polyketide cyclase / dehydrase and lipid transport
MTSLRHEILLDVPASEAWAALKNIPKTHELFAGVLVDGRPEGDTRTVTFANGMVARERIVAVDDSRMRVAYAVLDMFDQHAASMRVVPVGPRQCRFVWISDFLPDTKAEMVGPLMAQGCGALKRALEAPLRLGLRTA